MNTNKIATGSTSKRLLAALAVLAVAFVVLAAVPAVASDDSDAASAPAKPSQPSNTVTWDGVVAYDDNGQYKSLTPTLKASGDGYSYTIGKYGKVTFTVSKDLTIIAKNQFKTSLTIKPADGVSSVNVYLVVPAEGAADGASYGGVTNGLMTGKYCELDIKAGVNLVIDDQRDDSDDNAAFGRTIAMSRLVIRGNVWVESTGDAGIGSFDGDLWMSGGYLNLDNARSFGVSDYTKDGTTLKALTIKDGSSITWNVAGDSDVTKDIGITISGTASVSQDSSIVATGAARVVVATDLTLYGTIGNTAVESGKLTLSGASIASGATVLVNKEASLTGDLSYTTGTGTSAKTSSATLNVKAGTYGLTITTGSLIINGQVADSSSGTIEVADGSVISGEVSGDVTVTIKGAVSTDGDLTLGNGTTLKFDSSAALTVSKNDTLTFGKTAKVDSTNYTAGTSIKTEDSTAKVAAVADSTDTSTYAAQALGSTLVTVAGYSVAQAAEADRAFKDGANTAAGSYTVALSSDTLYSGEAKDIVATVSLSDSSSNAITAGYKVSNVYYTVAGAYAGEATLNDDGTYTISISSASGDVVVYATIVGAYSAVFYIDNVLVSASSASELKPNSSVSVPTVSGKRIAWTLADGTPVSLGTTISVDASQIYYGTTTDLYAVSVGTYTEGTVTPDNYVAAENDTVTLTVGANKGYRFVSVSAGDIQVTKVDDTTYTFVMPAADVSVTAVFATEHAVKNGTSTGGDGTIFGFSDESTALPAASTSTTDYVAIPDEKVYVTVSPGTGKAVQGVYYYTTAYDTTKYTTPEAAYKAGLISQAGSITANSVYAFDMPDADVTVIATFDTLYTVTIGTITGGTFSADPASTVAGHDVVLTGAPTTDGWILSALTVAPTDTTSTIASKTLVRNTDGTYTVIGITIGDDGTYSFEMPAANVTVTATFVQSWTITQILTKGSGTVAESGSVTAAEGDHVSFTVRTISGSQLDTIVLVGDTSGTYKYTAGASSSYWSVSSTGNVYTFTMPGVNFDSITFNFKTIEYWYVTLTGETSNAALYSDAAFTKEIAAGDDGTYAVDKAAGVVYLRLGQVDKKDIIDASAGYRASAAATSLTYVDVTQIELSTGSSDYEYYSIPVEHNTTVVAGYADHYATVTYHSEYPKDATGAAVLGTIAVTDSDGNAIESGARLIAGTQIVIAATGTTTDSARYVLTGLTVNGEDIAAEKTFEIGMEDSYAIEQVFAQGYIVTVTNEDGNIEYTVTPDQGVADTEVTLTVTPKEGYIVKSVTVARSDVTNDVEDGKYTFTLTADTEVVLVADVDPDGSAATEVVVTIGTRNGASVIQLTGIDGYILSGTITLEFNVEYDGTSVPVTATMAYTNENKKSIDFVAFDTASFVFESDYDAQLLSSAYAVSVHYSSGTVVSEETPVVLMEFARE